RFLDGSDLLPRPSLIRGTDRLHVITIAYGLFPVFTAEDPAQEKLRRHMNRFAEEAGQPQLGSTPPIREPGLHLLRMLPPPDRTGNLIRDPFSRMSVHIVEPFLHVLLPHRRILALLGVGQGS